MGVQNVLKFIIICCSIALAVLIIKKDKRTMLYLSVLIFFDAIIMFELSFGTLITKPKMMLKEDTEIVNVEVNTEYNDIGAIAMHHDKDISKNILSKGNVDITKLGTYEINYTLKVFSIDLSCTRKVNVVDTTKPVIELNGSRDIKIYEGTEFTEDGYKAIDNYDGDITDKVIVEKEQVSDTQFKMNYKVADSSNNEADIYRVIDIVPREQPADSEKNGVIYLTFDDGPSLDITPHILDILKEEDVKATFFVINFEGPEKEELIKRIVAEGHTIGVHGYSHTYKTIYSDDEAFMNNIKSLEEKIFNLTGVDTKIIRFPGGSSNTVSKKYSPQIMSRLTQRVITEGYRYFDWNVTSGDSGDVDTSQEVYKNVTNRISKNKPNIVLMHDFYGNNKTLDCLRDIIHFAKENEYTFEAIDEHTPTVVHEVAN